MLDLIVRGGLQPPEVNVPLVLSGRRIVPDFRWPAQRLVVEADGAAWHDHRIAREDDAERQALLEDHGERVLRVTWEQAVARPDQTLRRLRAAGAPSKSRRTGVTRDRQARSTNPSASLPSAVQRRRSPPCRKAHPRPPARRAVTRGKAPRDPDEGR